METAIYTDVKRFAVHDGPGIRTTIFLKGCPLHCIWCHNPECVSLKPELAFHQNKCVGCGECAKLCSCHSMEDGVHKIDRKRCIVCGKCADNCPSGALNILGKAITTEQATKLLAEDRIFYGEDGGATISGGEPLVQAKFCAELLAGLKREGINCVVDTCGNVPWNAFETVLPHTDMFLYDLKAMDSAKHQQLTGSGNERILENLRKLDAVGKPIEIRMIQVPGINMSEEEIEVASDFLAGLHNITAVRLLPYHSQARSKYQAIGRPDTMPDVPSPVFEDLEKSATILRSHGLQVINSLEK